MNNNDIVVCNHFLSSIAKNKFVHCDFVLHHYDRYIPEYEKQEKRTLTHNQLEILETKRSAMYENFKFPEKDRKKKHKP